jgi:PBSX family phage terminase large subunit
MYFRCNMNGTEAYSRLHPKTTYDSCRSQASTLLTKHNIRAEISKRLDELAMPKSEILARLGAMARGTAFKFIRITEDGFCYFNFSDPDAEQYFYLIKKIKTKRARRLEGKGKTAELWEDEWVEVELHDARAALEILGRYHRLEQPEIEAKSDVGKISLPAELLAPDFFASHRAILSGEYSEFLEYGGRGSTKSTFFGTEIPLLLINDPTAHALVIRQVKGTLRESVYSQIEWCINLLGLSDQFRCINNPMEITYIPTGQKIFFRGADDPAKIKSIKPPFGAIKILWFEELPEFHGAESIRSITQSAIRGTDKAYIFKSWNPPQTSGNWVNKYLLVTKPKQWRHKSDYRSVPADWLGKAFIDEAEFLKEVNPKAYDHEYLGEVNGLGDMVFENLDIRAITDEEIKRFESEDGLDFGYFPHPAHYAKTYYQSAKHTLFIFGECRKWKASNREMYDAILESGYNKNDLLIADSEDPKSIADYRDFGAKVIGSEKGPGSVTYSMKWLQSLVKIVIDPKRCPYTAEEFTDYAYERTKDGEIIEAYPREKDDAIAAVRYSQNLQWRKPGE